MTDEISRENRIANLLLIIDNVGDTDGVDLLALSNEEFDLLEEKV